MRVMERIGASQIAEKGRKIPYGSRPACPLGASRPRAVVARVGWRGTAPLTTQKPPYPEPIESANPSTLHTFNVAA